MVTKKDVTRNNDEKKAVMVDWLFERRCINNQQRGTVPSSKKQTSQIHIARSVQPIETGHVVYHRLRRVLLGGTGGREGGEGVTPKARKESLAVLALES